MAGQRRAAQRAVETRDSARGEERVQLVEGVLHLFGSAHQLEFEQRGLADQVDGALAIGEPRKLHRDPVLAFPLDQRLGHAELVDTVADDLHRALGRVLRLGGIQPRAIHLEHQVHAALQVESEMDRLPAQLRELLRGKLVALCRRERVVAVGRVEVVGGQERHRQHPHQLPLVGAGHRIPQRSTAGRREEGERRPDVRRQNEGGSLRAQRPRCQRIAGFRASAGRCCARVRACCSKPQLRVPGLGPVGGRPREVLDCCAGGFGVRMELRMWRWDPGCCEPRLRQHPFQRRSSSQSPADSPRADASGVTRLTPPSTFGHPRGQSPRVADTGPQVQTVACLDLG